MQCFFVDIVKGEPAWHRNLRKQRQRDRGIVAAVKLGSPPSFDLVQRATGRLNRHHGSSAGNMATGSPKSAWLCKSCKDLSGQPLYNKGHRDRCFKCNIAKGQCHLGPAKDRNPPSKRIGGIAARQAEQQKLAQKQFQKQQKSENKEINDLKKQLKEAKELAKKNKKPDLEQDGDDSACGDDKDSLQREISDLQSHITWMEKSYGADLSGLRASRLESAKAELVVLKERQRSSMDPDKQYQVLNKVHKQAEAKVLKARDALADARQQLDKWMGIVDEKHKALQEAVTKADETKEKLKLAQSRLAGCSAEQEEGRSLPQQSPLMDIQAQIHSLVQEEGDESAFLALYQKSVQLFKEEKKRRDETSAAAQAAQAEAAAAGATAATISLQQGQAPGDAPVSDADMSTAEGLCSKKDYHMQSGKELLCSTALAQKTRTRTHESDAGVGSDPKSARKA